MRLWTIQPAHIYEALKGGYVYRCDPEKAQLLTESSFGPAYDWLSEQMRLRIGAPPDGVKYPVWAWHTLEWKHKRPDLRRVEFCTYRAQQVCMEIEIPDTQVLLSNEDMWHIVLNNGFYGDCCTEQEWEAEEKWFEKLSSGQQIQYKRKSWEKIFDVSPARETAWDAHGKYVQATFWELKPEHACSVRHFGR